MTHLEMVFEDLGILTAGLIIVYFGYHVVRLIRIFLEWEDFNV